MSLKNRALTAINSVLRGLDVEIIRKSHVDALRERREKAAVVRKSHPACRGPAEADSLPEGAEAYLTEDHPRLVELRRAYRSLACAALDPSVWGDGHLSSRDLRFFRGDNAYVWQFREEAPEVSYLLAAYYARSIDRLGLLDRLEEDRLFGVYGVDWHEGRVLTRDLLDSIVEIYFLERTLGISGRTGMNVLDIGAGYGRLAHRLVGALPALGNVFCTDAVAESTFISEYYLRYRNVDHKAKVVPLFDIEALLTKQPVDLAVNIHSFSECTMEAVCWWLDLLAKHRVQYLMVVPNPLAHGGTKLMTTEKDGTFADFLPAITSRGYRLHTQAPKYGDPGLQKHGLSPTRHYLFEIQSTGF